MTYVQIAIGLGRKTRANLGFIHLTLFMVLGIARRTAPAAASMRAFFQVGFDDLSQEVGGLDHFRCVVFGVGGCAHILMIVGRLARESWHCGCSRPCPLLCRAYRSAPLQTNRHTPLPLFYLCADIQNVSCSVMRLISSSEGKNHMHTALTHHLGIRCLATVSLFAALAATQAQAGNVGVSIGIYVPGVPVYVAPPPPPPPPRAVRHMPPPYVVYAPPPRGFYGPPPRHHIPPGHYKHAPKRRGHMHYGPPPHRR